MPVSTNLKTYHSKLSGVFQRIILSLLQSFNACVLIHKSHKRNSANLSCFLVLALFTKDSWTWDLFRERSGSCASLQSSRARKKYFRLLRARHATIYSAAKFDLFSRFWVNPFASLGFSANCARVIYLLTKHYPRNLKQSSATVK